MNLPFIKNADSVKNANKGAQTSTQLHLRIAEIRDNTLVLKNGGIRGITEVSSVNFNLKSEEEQNAIIYSYQNFLNTLDFPVQIVIRSKKLEIDNYVESLKQTGEKQKNPLLQRQTFDYIDYIQRLIEYADIMEKKFYIVVPADPPRAEGKNFLSQFWERMHPEDSVATILRRHREFEELRKKLTQRLNVAKTGLENCGLKVQELTTQEIIELFYQCYNPLTSRNQKAAEIEKTKLENDASLGR